MHSSGRAPGLRFWGCWVRFRVAAGRIRVSPMQGNPKRRGSSRTTDMNLRLVFLGIRRNYHDLIGLLFLLLLSSSAVPMQGGFPQLRAESHACGHVLCETVCVGYNICHHPFGVELSKSQAKQERHTSWQSARHATSGGSSKR